MILLINIKLTKTLAKELFSNVVRYVGKLTLTHLQTAVFTSMHIFVIRYVDKGLVTSTKSLVTFDHISA